MAERMQARVSELRVEHLGSDVDQVVTISLGVASMVPTPSETPELLLKAADQQLYEAKRTGRARVCALTTS